MKSRVEIEERIQELDTQREKLRVEIERRPADWDDLETEMHRLNSLISELHWVAYHDS